MIIVIMMASLIFLIFVSIFYVFKFRGVQRYESFTEYIRKGWPIFAPLNCLLYVFTKQRARMPIMQMSQFRELDEIQKNWKEISQEVLNLHKSGFFNKTSSPDSAAYYDLGFRTFYKYGWSKFYVNWYGYTHESAKKWCPKTLEVLSRVPTVNGAMFSVLPAGSKLTRHLDPVACSLRYHLGLSTPNNESCYINVDGTSYSWKDGEAFLFDETYLHYAYNNSSQDRLILMCEVERPLYLIGKVINFFYKCFARLSVVPNTPEDKHGLINSIFSGLSPLLKKMKNLKNTNLVLYKIFKYLINFSLFALSLLIIYQLFQLLGWIISLL